MEIKHFPKWVTPNFLSALRIFLVGPIIILFNRPYFLWQYLGIELYIFGVILDIIDGKLARETNQVTEIGKILDPLSDKILNIPILLYVGCKFGNNYYWVYLTSSMIGLDLILFVIAQIKYYLKDKIKLKTGANVYGKLKMGFQVGTIIEIFILKPFLDLEIIPTKYYFLILLPAELALLTAIIFALGSIKGHLTLAKD